MLMTHHAGLTSCVDRVLGCFHNDYSSHACRLNCCTVSGLAVLLLADQPRTFAGTLKVIDFGLSKKYLDDAGNLVAQKEGKVGFRGSTAYASLFAHEEQELGKHPADVRGFLSAGVLL